MNCVALQAVTEMRIADLTPNTCIIIGALTFVSISDLYENVFVVPMGLKCNITSLCRRKCSRLETIHNLSLDVI